MQNRFFNLLLLLIITVIVLNCANRGTPSGGEKDITPPEIIKTTPKNYSTNFKANVIRIYFDEYVKVKNLNKQLIISPPMNTQPEITPLGSASKYIQIKIYDTLKPNTTYAFNFGNSIVDNNEENPYNYYKYVLSTGSYIDSLTLKGNVFDAIERTPDNFISVNLYEIDSTYTDSIVYKENPKYVTNTLDSTTNFTLENLKAGTYKLVALKDNNQNNKYEQRSDKIGFYNDVITIPDSSSYDIKLFKEKLDYKALKPRLVAGEKIIFGYQGDYRKTNIELLSKVVKSYKYRFIKERDKDTLNYFYTPKLEVDSLVFKVTNKKTIDTFSVKIKDNKQDSLLVSGFPSGNIGMDEKFKLFGNIPIKTIDQSFIKIIDKDSVTVKFTTQLDSLENALDLNFNKTLDNQYRIQALPQTLTDLFGNTNDTLNYVLRTKKETSYANTRINLRNAKYPVIVQMVDKNGEVKYEKISAKPEPVDFRFINPNEYYIRVIFDANKNGVYDPGNFLKQQQPERVSYYPEVKDIRSGWDEIIEFTLLD